MTETERKERRKITNKKYRETHKEQIKEAHRKWREKNREHINAKAREQYKENSQPFKDRNNRYKIENRQKCTDYERNKRHNDSVYRLRTNLRNLIRRYTKGKGYKGSKSVYEILGCDFDYFKDYIEKKFKNGMTFENYGEWNIDHIIPISSAKNDEDLEILNHYTNLQPLWANENYKKGKKIL